ncbi:MAG: hypothetical protein QOK02_3456, partial [Mycobacterium sp.]|nr:hypothetical protein [Mycobacterium sp.]
MLEGEGLAQRKPHPDVEFAVTLTQRGPRLLPHSMELPARSKML